MIDDTLETDWHPGWQTAPSAPHDAARPRVDWLSEIDADAAAGDIAPDLLRDVILPSQLLASGDCLDVYRSMFALRIEAALETRFPAVRSVVGEIAFSRLCADHAAACAGDDPAPEDVEARFAGHIASSERLDATQRAWLADLARLERAIDVADAAGDAQPLTLAELIDVPRERWYCTYLVPAPSVQLLALDHQVDGAYEAWLAGDVGGDLPPEPLRHAQWLVVHRALGEREGRVERVSLPRRAFALASALCSGRSLRDALDEALGAHARAETQHRLFQWLCAWVGSGMFRAIETR